MSYILDALKKSDAERKRGEVPTITDAPGDQAAPHLAPSSGLSAKLLIIGGGALVLAGGLGAWALLGGHPPAPQPETAALSEPVAEPTPEPTPQEQMPEQVQEQAPPAAEEDTPKPEDVVQAAPAPQPLSEPDPVAEPDPVTEPAREVAVLKAETAPPPKPEAQAQPIPAPVTQPKAAIEESTPPQPTPKATSAAVKVTPLGSAQAHVDRAWQSIDKGLFARAVADLDAATALEPAYADAWFARGWANEKNGDEAQAVIDYGRAIAAKPDHAFALFSRGFLNLYIGNPRDAAVDFVRTRGVAQDRGLKLYSHLWLYLSRARSGQNAQAALKEDANADSLAQWPGPLVLHYMGAMDEAGVLRAIAEGPKSALKERQATGYFFLGALALELGNQAQARTYFEKTLATGAVDFRQYDAAERELDRLAR